MLDKEQRYVLLGSCFSQYMGLRMQAEGYDAVCNPLGTLFNPESIKNTVTHALMGTEASLPMFFDESMHEWRCWLANTRFRSSEELEARKDIHAVFNVLREQLRQANRLFLTLGTNVCYRLQDTGLVVSNCQRQPDRLFCEDTLSVEQVVDVLDEMLGVLWNENPQLRVTFTVSPYRYRKYGWHRSQLSKATLLLAIDELQRSHPDRIDYFPSYEIMMDELRDFSYYAEDGLHPSEQAVDIIWKRLCE